MPGRPIGRPTDRATAQAQTTLVSQWLVLGTPRDSSEAKPRRRGAFVFFAAFIFVVTDQSA
jgi:hypothetical protein